MKKVSLSLVVAACMFSCSSIKNVNTSSLSETATMLSSLSSNSTLQQITSLFGLLDTNKDDAISTTEATGTVSENFEKLDTDNNSSLNLTELQGLIPLLK